LRRDGAEATGVEETIVVTTAENVAFSYALAGLGSRFLAVLLDLLIQLAIAAVVALILALFGFFTLFGHKSGQAIALSIAILLFFAIFYAYFVFFEADDGRTPGKRLIGIRVVRDGGFPLDFSSALIRNVIRVLEAALGFYAVSAACVLASPQNKRLGDMAAGTLVVRERTADRHVPAIPAARADNPLVRDLRPFECEIILRYVERRGDLSPAARQTLAGEIAQAVRPRLGATFNHLDDDTLLVYVAESALQ
jgi:uncharacterized RDD family membrane protein YckC